MMQREGSRQMSRVALCVDSESAQRPQVIGLPDEVLEAQSWLELLCDAEEARAALLHAQDVAEAWVVSCNNMEAVNLAAALKADVPQRPVLLVSQEQGGSVRSCAAKAGIDQVIDFAQLTHLYAQRKALRGAAFAPEVIRGNPERPVSRPDLVGLDVFPSEAKSFFLPVVSGSGGSGKSTVSLLMAMLLQRAGLKTLLVDFDLQFGDLDALAGVPDAMGVDDLLRSPARVGQLVPQDGMPALLKAPVRLEDAESLGARIPQVLDAVQGRFDVVVANTGAFWTEVQAQLLERSSKALFLIDQRASSLRACKHALDLCARCGIAASPFVFVPNRCEKGAPLTSIDVSCSLHGATSYELAEGGMEVEEALAEGQPLDLLNEENALVESLDQLLRNVVPAYAQAIERAEAAARKPSLWRRLGFERKKSGEVSGGELEGQSA